MRKQLSGLVDIIQYSFKLDPYSDSLFLSCGRRADRIKAVHYEGDGFCLLYKRYESGRLQCPRTGEEAKQISAQQLRCLKEQVDLLTRKLYRIKSEKTSAPAIEGQMSLFNETEYFADPNAKEPELVEVEKHLRKRKYAGQREELVKDIPRSKVLHTIDESEQVCEKCRNSMVKVGEESVRTDVQFIPASLKVIDHYRETYECRFCRKQGTPYMEKALVPYLPVLHSLASASTIAWLVHQKLELGIPLYRQEKEWKALGLKLGRAFVDALPKEVHPPEASKPAEAVLRLN